MLESRHVGGWMAPLATSLMFNWLNPGVANACSAPSCTAGEVFPTDGQVPANGFALFERDAFHPSWADADAGIATHAVEIRVVDANGNDRDVEFVQATLTDDESAAEKAADIRWIPSTPLTPGDRVEVKYADSCSGDTQSAKLSIVGEAVLPDALGTMRLTYTSDELELWSGTAACTDSISTRYVDVVVELSDEAKPYAATLRYGLWVDGELFESDDWPDYDDDWTWGPGRGIGGSRLGRGVERVFAICEPTDGEVGGGVSAGKHQIQLRAFLPDGSQITTAEQEIDLTCEATERPAAQHLSSGCDLRGASTGSRTALMAMLMGLVFARRTRRRRDQSRH